MVNPDKSDVNPDEQVLDMENMEEPTVTVDADGNEVYVDPEDDGIPILEGWSAPVERPVVTPEQEKALSEMSRLSRMTPDEQLNEILKMQQVNIEREAAGEDLTTDASKSLQDAPESSKAPEAEQVATEYKVAPKIDARPPHPLYEATMGALGVSETSDLSNPAFDPAAPLHTPIEPKEIMEAQNLTADDLPTAADSDTSPVESSELPEGFADTASSEIDPESIPSFTMELSSEDESVPPILADPDDLPELELSAEPAIELKPESKVVPAPEPEPEKEPDQQQEPEPVQTEQTADLRATAEAFIELAQTAPEEPVAPAQESAPATAVLDSEPTLEFGPEKSQSAALDDIPSSTTGELTGADIKIESDNPTTELSEDEDGVITPNMALKNVSTILSVTAFGEEDGSELIFDPEDMTIMADANLDPSHIVISNMTLEERAKYVVQSNPEGIRKTAATLFGSATPYYKVVREGVDALQDALDSPTYVQRIHQSNEQMNNPAAVFSNEILKHAFETHAKENPDKPLYMGPTVKLKSRDGKDEPKIIADSFASKEALFRQLAAGQKAIISGKSATKVAATLINCNRKVHYYNSGFYTRTVAPSPAKLAKYYNSVAEGRREYGRILGQFACLPVGVETRAALLDLWESCVVESNLKDWTEPGKLRKALSVLDIPVVAWSLASLLYPRGVDLEYVCRNDVPASNGKEAIKCRHIESVKYDINTMRYNNWSLLSADAIFFADSSDARDLDDLVTYRQTYLQDQGTLVHVTPDKEWSVDLHIPDAYTAEEKHRGFIAGMVEDVQLHDMVKADQYSKTKLFFSFAPYIKAVGYTSIEENKRAEFVDSAALETTLDMLQLLDDVSLPEELHKYLAAHTVSHICFSYNQCPKCGKYPKDAHNRLVACDPEYAFFVWATAKVHR